MSIVIINAGSSSIKFSLYSKESGVLIVEGIIDRLLTQPMVTYSYREQQSTYQLSDVKEDYEQAIKWIYQILQQISKEENMSIVAVGHRIVHGGSVFTQPVIIEPHHIEQLKALIPFAPLHQPFNVLAIEVIYAIDPHVKQIACFDTAFHAHLPPLARDYALPDYLVDQGIRRYGFHGLSYGYIASVLPQYDKKAATAKIIVAHLGNGASLCALNHLQSVATTMGMTPLEGLMMGTRCGDIDPGIVLYLMQQEGMTAKHLSDLLYKQSGLKGVSGMSSDVRQLLTSDDPHAHKALAMFSYHVAKHIGSLMVALGGLDMIVFTGGIGEHAWQVRADICKHLACFGVELVTKANQENQHKISGKKSKIDVWVIPTKEDHYMVSQLTKMIS